MSKNRFSDEMLAAVRKGLVIGVRAGTQPHRFIGIWAVVVEKRVFVRSWSQTPHGWHQTFCEHPRGIVQIAGQEFAVRTIQTRSERLKKAVDHAFLEKYHTPGSIKYARDLCRPKAKATTTELVPL